MYSPTSSSESEEDLRKMELVYFSNEFPKEDLVDIFRRLHNHSKDRNHSLLAQFLDEATLAVKDEVKALPMQTKRQFPPFSTIFSWAENAELRQGLMCGAVDGVLLVVTQLAAYIGYHEKHLEQSSSYAKKSLAALGVGLLSAAAVAQSSTLSELPQAGADAVRLAFRMGIHVQSVSDNLEARDVSEPADTWAYVVPNVDPAAAQEELDAIHSGEDMPESGKVFVSAVSRTSVTISGPPSKLKSLFNKSEFFRDTRSIALPVYGGLCHAPHIYSQADVQSIINFSALTNASSRPAMAVYSTSTGLPYQVKTAGGLFECVVSELLTKAIYWDNAIQGIVDQASCGLATEAVLHCFSNSIPLNDLNTALKASMPQLRTSVNNLMQWPFGVAPKGGNPRSTAQAKLAIVGMSCRLPGGATSTEAFWNILEQGLDVSRRIPSDRFDVETHFDPTGKQLNKTMTQYGCFVDEPGLFDAPFFNMSPREAQVVDPQMRLALVTAYEALERSGYVSNRTAATMLQRIGTWYGQAADDYREVNQGQEVSTYYIPGGCRAFGPGRINYFFKFAGPSYSIDTACSSGLAAIEVACQALWNGEVDTAVTGGMNILTNPDGFAGLCNGHFLTKGHNACKTWDATADGYCRADGVGSLVIKRLEDAEADNDNILGVILGTSTNHSAEAVSITHPHAGHQAYLSRQVLRHAGVDPLDVSYVELHGTGTQAGDHEEMQGIMDVYAPLTKRRNKNQPLHIGAVKANVGHGESVAGTTALIKVLLMLQHNAIPPHIGIKTEINPKFPKDFDKRNLHIALEQTDWPQVPGKKRLAAVNNFGAAGGNTTMVLEEAPVRVITEADPRQTHIIAVSAKTKTSLAGNIERLIAYLDSNSSANLADLAYTTTARRYQHTHRVTVAANDIAQLKKQLASRLEKVDSVQPVAKSGPPPVCFAFTGQGASHKSMNLELYRDVPTFRQQIQHLDALATRQGFPSFIHALDGSHYKDHAHPPVVTQLALVCTEIALAKYWASIGVKPDVIVGHSLGEYAAMHIAGVTTASDTIFMVGRRAQMLQDKCQIGSHTMMAVRASLSQIAKSSAGKTYTIACSNGPSDTVLSGTKAQMEEVAKPLQSAGYRCINLDVAFAFHSEQTDPILNDFRAIAKTGVVFKEPKLPVISPLLGKVVFDGKTLNANYVARATRESVDFLSALQNAQKISTISDETIWVEIGPHPVCTGFVKSTIPSTKVVVPSIRRDDDNWKTMAESMATLHLAGIAVDWNEFHRPFESRLRLLDLPTYAWNEKNYWLQYEGDWALTKGNKFYTAEKDTSSAKAAAPRAIHSSVKTSTVQHIIEESFQDGAGLVAMESDLIEPDFLAAAHGHRMNGCGVVTSSIHADIAYTLGEYLFKKLNPSAKSVHMNVADLVVTKGLVANQDTSQSQCIRVTAKIEDIAYRSASLCWQNVEASGETGEAFATATLYFGDSTEWIRSWIPMTHFVQSRIQALEQLVVEGKANRYSRKMAYLMFANNLVNYADKYRGMQAVTIHELEAFADVQLSTEKGGIWTVPPYFIDSVAHLAGFVMNCSDAIDTQIDFCVTPGWQSMRFAKSFVPGAKYRSYVKMIPTEDDPTIYLGDVYILQDDAIMGVVGSIQFRRYPRVLLNRFFSAPDKSGKTEAKAKATTPLPVPKALEASKPAASAPASSTPEDNKKSAQLEPQSAKEPAAKVTVTKEVNDATPAADSNSIAAKAVQLIANEAALDTADLGDEASMADLGIDSLMSLVISEKFGSELNVKVSGSLFIDFPTIGGLKNWLTESYG